MKPKAAFFNNPPQTLSGPGSIERVFGKGRFEQVAELVDLYPHRISSSNFSDHAAELQDLDVIFATWGMPCLSAGQVAQMPELKALFYAAGSVKPFAQPFLEAGVTVVSAWVANAIPVAEFVLAQILLSCKAYFRNTIECRNSDIHHNGKVTRGAGVYGEKIALIGMGQIGRKLVELLRPFRLDVLAVDPYLSKEDAECLGVRVVSLEEAFAEAYVVSNHLPNLETLRGVLNGKLFASMRPGATFINTGRGAQVEEADLIAALQDRPDLTALLDVTYPEPPAVDSPFYALPNVQLTSHIAGSLGDEVLRMADYMIEECQAWLSDKPLRYAVTMDMLQTMA